MPFYIWINSFNSGHNNERLSTRTVGRVLLINVRHRVVGLSEARDT
ncbi:MAG: hypothetical protein ACI9W7_000099, partial [Porticoccaceae bacterium]